MFLILFQVLGDKSPQILTNRSASDASCCHDNNKSQDALDDRLDGLRLEDGKMERLEQLLAKTKSLTAKQDLVQKLRWVY